MSTFVWLVLLMTAVALLLRVDFIVYLLYVVVGVYLWSRFYTPQAIKGLVAERSFARRAFLGEVVTITMNVHNKGRLAIPWVQLSESVAPELRMEDQTQRVVSLKGHATDHFSYHVRGQQRGYYQIGPLRIASGDMFGLGRHQIGYLPPDHLTIYPRIVPLAHLGLPSRLPYGTIGSRQRLFEDPARPMGARPFHSGDSLRQINWKASAHNQQLLIRTLQPAVSLETIVFLNLHQDDYERSDRHYSTEWAIVVAASLAAHLVQQRQPVGLFTNGVDPLRIQEDEREYDDATGRLRFSPPRALMGSLTGYMGKPIRAHTGRPHLMKILEQLARLETANTIPFTDWVPSVSQDLSWGVTILAITARGDAHSCNTMHRLARAGYNPILIVIEPDQHFGQVRERARQLGFQAINVSGKEGLDHWRRAPAASAFAG